MHFKYFSLIALSLPIVSLAEEKKIWSGSVDIAINNLTGNTQEQTLSGKAELIRENNGWKWMNKASGYYTESGKQRTAEKYDASSYLSYNFVNKSYIFARAVYETDKFSGFDYQTNYILGLGWNIYQRETFQWDAELGAGYRSSIVEKNTQDQDRHEAIATASTTLDWQFSERSAFKQYLSVEVGEDITISYATSELSVKMIDNLVFKLSYHVKHTSKVPEGTEKLDTETIASFGYTF